MEVSGKHGLHTVIRITIFVCVQHRLKSLESSFQILHSICYLVLDIDLRETTLELILRRET
jgi:hypothetical protein